MVLEAEFRALLAQRGLAGEDVEAAVAAVCDLERFAVDRGLILSTLSVDLFKEYVQSLISAGTNTRQRLISLARYFYVGDLKELYVYMVGIVGQGQVIAALAERAEVLEGVEVRESVFGEIEIPPLGSPQDKYPAVTQRIVAGLRSALPLGRCKRVLAGNNHKVPEESFTGERAKYLEAGVDEMLKYRREKLLSELEAHARSGKPWYEQIITPEVVEFVRRNPEIQAGLREGDTIFVSKIPYSPQEYLSTSDPTMKRYYQCHCPLARTSILDNSPPVDPLFCYCSGGYEKLPFDVVFDEPVEVEVLRSALAGDTMCRFAIKIPEGKMR